MGTLMRLTIACFLFINSPVQAQGNQSLQPEQKAGVRFVGQALLSSMRTAKSPDEVISIRNNLDQLRRNIDELARLDQVGSLTLLLENGNQVSVKDDSFELKRTAALNDVDAVLQKVKQARHSLISKNHEEQTVWARIGSWFSKPDLVYRPENPVIKSIPIKALGRIEDIEEEIQIALSMPNEERRLRLTKIAKQITFRKASLDYHLTNLDDESNLVRDDSPTLHSRTKHRRTFNVN